MGGNKSPDGGLLLLRLAAGGMLAGHGAQKLFGVFGGPGLEGTAGFMEMLGLKPGQVWGTAAAVSEFGGGALTALGLLHPLGPVAMISAMTMAANTAHAGKPIWAQEGGAELAVTNGAAALAIIVAGPGEYSVDRALGIRLPNWIGVAAAAAALGTVAFGLLTRTPPPNPPPSHG